MGFRGGVVNKKFGEIRKEKGIDGDNVGVPREVRTVFNEMETSLDHSPFGHQRSIVTKVC